MWPILGRFLGGLDWHTICVGNAEWTGQMLKRDIRPVLNAPRGIAKRLAGRESGGPATSTSIHTVARLLGVCLIGSGLSACAVGSMGAMMGGGADGVAALSSEGAQVADAAPQTPAHEEFIAMAEVIDTPVWAALGPLDRDRGGIFNMGSVVGMLLAGHEEETEPEQDSPTAQAERYLASLDSIFDDRNQVAVAMSVDIFRKNSESRRFISAAREVVSGHEWSVASVNAAFQAGEIDAPTYRSQLSRLDADRRVLGQVMSSLQDQRQVFNRARAILISDDPTIDLSRVDEEMASLAQYQELAARLSATISGETELSS